MILNNIMMAIGVVCVMVSASVAQPIPAKQSDWARVSSLSAGTQVEVIYSPLKRAVGSVSQATEDVITMETAEGNRRILRSDVKRVTVNPHSRRNRTLIGAAIGAGALAATIAIAANAGDIDFRHAYLVGGAAVLGAGAGAGIGALSGGSTTIYRAP